MAGEVVIRKLVARGLNELYPKVWEVWGTSKTADALEVSFAGFGADAASSKSVMVMPRPCSEVYWDIKCEPDERMWGARFYAQEHPELGPLRGWLKADASRAVEVEVRAALEAGTETSAALARSGFKDADIIRGYEFQAGVLLVHGIGNHPQGDTLVRFTEPIVDFLQGWLRVASDQRVEAYSKTEAQAWRDRIFKSTLRHQQNLFDLTDEVERFVRRASAKATADPGSMPGEFLVGDACVIDTILRPLASDPQIAGTALIRLSTLERSGALDQSHVLVSEAWWTKDAAPPTTTQLRDWIVYALPQVVSTYFAAPTQAMQRQLAGRSDPKAWLIRALDAFSATFVRGPLALWFCALVQAALVIVATLSLLPIPWLRSVLKPVIDLLLGTTGQSYAMVTSELRRSAIVSKVGQQLDWLCERCESVLVLAHSQGGEVTRHVVGTRRRRELRRVVSFGSGVKLLDILSNKRPSQRHVVCAAVALVLVLAYPLLVVGFDAPVWRTLLWTHLALALIGLVFLDPPSYNPTFRRSVPLTDYYASKDPVPCGPLTTDEAKLKEIGFEITEVHNRASVLFDHTSYLENTEEFVAPVALEIAKLAGMPLDELVKGDTARLEQAKAARRRLLVQKQWIGRLAVLGLLVAGLFVWIATSWTLGEAGAALRRVGSVFTQWPDAETMIPTLATLYQVLPIVLVAALYIIERIVLHGHLVRNARTLVTRRDCSRQWAPAIGRAVAYVVAALAMAWWIRDLGVVTALGVRFAV